ncbi:MAG: LCP family protein, partial [Candidatus Eremiobacteraeota bacterium]|nr:LCP family protein [Candidatus Eremiobacteraeota bacterium]
MGKHLAQDQEYSGPRTSPGRRIMLALGVAFIVGALGIFGVAIAKHENPLQVLTQSVVPDPQAVFNKDRILVLVVGRDYDYNDKDFEMSKNARSDLIQVYSMDFVNHTINEVSVPRDMDVVLNGHENKINQALSDGGITESEAVVAKFLGIPGIDRYVALRINSSKQLIDAIGGIDVPVKETMDYDDSWGHLHIHFKAGKLYHMNGEAAVSYGRFRHDACGDPCRIERQQQVIHLIAGKLKSNKLNDLAHLGQLIDIMKKSVDTNMSTTELLSLAGAFQNLDAKTIRMAQVKYIDTKDTPYGGNVLIADDAQKQKIVNQLLLEPAPVAGSPSPGDLSAIAPSSIKVDVKNGS